MAETPECEDAHGDCTEALHELYVFIDGELTEERRVVIQRHLDGCSPCFEVYGFEAELRRVVAYRCRDSVPDALRQRIADALGINGAPGMGDAPGIGGSAGAVDS